MEDRLTNFECRMRSAVRSDIGEKTKLILQPAGSVILFCADNARMLNDLWTRQIDGA